MSRCSGPTGRAAAGATGSGFATQGARPRQCGTFSGGYPPASLVARALLSLLVGGLPLGLGGCLPPDFEIEPDENRPVTIDKSLLTRSPDEYQNLSDCEPRTFDITNAIVDPDADDPVTIAWIVDYQPGQGVEPDADNRLRFTFDPCTNPKARPGKVSTVEVFVLDRVVPFDILADVDALKAFDDNDVTTDNVVWFVGFESAACCEVR